MTGPQRKLLPDGRLHLNHGPIDLICEAWGDAPAVGHAYARVAVRFDGLLAELVAELPALRCENAALTGPIARLMARAVAPFRPQFITPMAAVAGSVAETILAVMVKPGITKAYVNNGGDIALHLSPGETLTAAIGLTAHRISMHSDDQIRGIATSGWRGRSFSLGIADCVTVQAETASMADAAATIIANAVDLPGHPAILRRPARDIQADSDLGTRLVTVAVGPLTKSETRQALDRGIAAAEGCRKRGLIAGAALFLNADMRTTGTLTLQELAHA